MLEDGSFHRHAHVQTCYTQALLVDWKVGAGPLVWLNLLPSGVPLKEAPIYFPLLVAPFLLAGIGAGDAQEGNDIDR